ncbi:MAG: SLC13 family permease [Deltaproteobacteria bacterium]|nr:SLC13 family permease [Deltaproteobacteria bacterium]
MSVSAWTTLATIIAVVVGMIFAQQAADLVMLAGVVFLLAVGILDPKEALGGMANEGMITVAALFVVTAAVERTGIINMLVDRLMGRPKSLVAAQSRVMIPPAIVSAFMNNTPIVAMMTPVIRDWARNNRISVSKLLLPMNNAVVLGGLCTLIGTSTNVVVSGLYREQTGAGLEMFAITPLGVPLLVVGVIYMLIFGRRLLADRKPVVSQQDDPRAYTVEMQVEPGGALVGKTIEAAGLRHLPGMFVIEINRGGETLAAVAPTEHLQDGDQLVFAGTVESVVDLQRIRGLVPATDQVFKLSPTRAGHRLIEAVVSTSCWLIGKTIRDAKFRTVYNAAVIAVGRDGERLNKKIGDIVLRPGDMLLIEGPPSFIERQKNSRDFFLVSEVPESHPPLHHKAWPAALILLAMVAVASLELMSMLHAALIAAALMVIVGCLPASQARRSLEWDTLLLIAASFGLAKALEKTGLANHIAGLLLGSGDHGPWMALAILYLATMLFTELLSNNAAAVLLFPIAWASAHRLGVNPMPFVMAITVAASCGFATPMGYQTNMMVYGPGGYHLGDYLRFGGVLNLIVAAATIALAPLLWPF